MNAKDLDGSVTILRVKLEGNDPKAFMEQVLSRAKGSDAEVLVIDDYLVFGEDHILSAAYHAGKAISEGRNSSDSLTMETLLYASGERQLGQAIKKMSVKDGTEVVAIAVLRGRLEPDESWEAAGPPELGSEDRRLLAFGITEDELRTVQPGKGKELVLERVAAVDVIKK